HAVSGEGRAQRSHAVMPPQGEARASWRWLQAGLQQAGRGASAPWESAVDVIGDMASELPVFAPLAVQARRERHPSPHAHRLPRELHRASGRTAPRAHLTVVEPRPAADPDGPYAFS